MQFETRIRLWKFLSRLILWPIGFVWFLFDVCRGIPPKRAWDDKFS